MALEDQQAQVPELQACQLSLGAGLKLDILTVYHLVSL